jgi:hypothetical protein
MSNIPEVTSEFTADESPLVDAGNVVVATEEEREAYAEASKEPPSGEPPPAACDFVPKPDISVRELAYIVQMTRLRISPALRDGLPYAVARHFVDPGK